MHEGKSVACKAGRSAHVSDAFTAELQAMMHGFDLAVQLGAIRIDVETDSLLLAQAINRVSPDYSKQAVPLEELKMQTKLWFSRCNIQYCHREANAAAHAIAKLGYSCNLNEASLWEDDVPAEAEVIVMGDRPILFS